MYKILWFLIVFLISPSLIKAQSAEKQRPSPAAITAVRYKDTYVKVTYSQPFKRGRQLFGKLVPYGQVWRTGANEATEITLTKDLQINGKPLKAGTYAIFTIPENDKWTIIINSDLGLWGSYNYNEKLDVMRFQVPVQTADKICDPFTISFDLQNDSANLLLCWDTVKISIPIKFVN